jgi:hypothetical protein
LDAGGRDGLVWSGLVVVAVWETSSYRVLSPQAVKMQPANAVAVSQSVQAAKHRDRSETLRRFGSLRPYFGFVCSRLQTAALFGLPYRILVLFPTSQSSRRILTSPRPRSICSTVVHWFRRYHWFHSGCTLVLRPASFVACR